MIEASAFDISCKCDEGQDLLSLPFYLAGKPLQDDDRVHPRCYMTTAGAGSMRFRWTEENPQRKSFFLKRNILPPQTISSVGISPITSPGDLYPVTWPVLSTSLLAVPVELIHSQVVYALEQEEETSEPTLLGREGSHPDALNLWRGDGIITTNPKLVPVVTVADCLPIFLYDLKTGCRGVLHSGWKGTGIVVKALKLAERIYGAQASDFSVVIGPHIHSCCYQVDEKRIEYFTSHFGSSCIIPPNHLSLAQANVNLLREAGVPEDNILCCSDCTCCDPRLGSFRRETRNLSENMILEEKLKNFTTMMAFIH